MTTREVAPWLRQRILASSVLALALVAAVAPAEAGNDDEFALECEVVAGIMSLRLSGPERTEVRGEALDGKTWVFEIDDPSLIGLRPGPWPCIAVESVRILPGYLLGARSSRIVVGHRGEEPRSYSKEGRHRLTWLPASSPAPRVAEADAALAVEPLSSLEPERARPGVEAPAQPSAAPAPDARERKRQEKVEKQAEKQAEQAEKQAEQAEKQAEQAEKQAQKQASREAERRVEHGPAQEQAKPLPGAPSPVESAAPETATDALAVASREAVVVAPDAPAVASSELPADYVALGDATSLIVTIPTDMKDGPGRRYETLRRLAAGERVMASGRAGDWYRVGGGEGWVFSTYLEAASAGVGSGPQLGVVQEITVPVFEGPGGQHAVVAELYRGQQVVIDELNGDWAHVRNGGWVLRSALGDLKPGQER